MWERNRNTRKQQQQARRRNPGKKRVLNTQRMISFQFIPFIYIPNLNPQIPTHDYPICSPDSFDSTPVSSSSLLSLFNPIEYNFFYSFKIFKKLIYFYNFNYSAPQCILDSSLSANSLSKFATLAWLYPTTEPHWTPLNPTIDLVLIQERSRPMIINLSTCSRKTLPSESTE